MSHTLTRTGAPDAVGALVRLSAVEDIPGLVRLEEAVWQERGATADQWEARLRTFPEGVIVATNSSGEIVGVVSFHVVVYDLHRPMTTWYEATDCGYVGNHDPSGNMAYGDTLTVGRHAPRDASTSLLVAAARTVVRQRLDGIIVGARMPRYSRYAEIMPATEYARLSFNGDSSYVTANGEHHRFRRDPELRLYRHHSLELVTVLPNYFDDPESLNWGAILVWKNFFRGLPFPGFWASLLTVRTGSGWRGFFSRKH